MRLTFPRIGRFSVKNNSENLNPIQSNGFALLLTWKLATLNLVQLMAIFVGQLVPADYNHNFGDNAVIDSVIMRIPIYSIEVLKLIRMVI